MVSGRGGGYGIMNRVHEQPHQQERSPRQLTVRNYARDVMGVVVQAGQIDHLHLPPPEPSAETVVVPLRGTEAAIGELFVGREQEKSALLDALRPHGRPFDGEGEQPAPAVSLVTGMGGVGKTTLARHAAMVAVERGWFPGGAVMVDLRGYEPRNRRIQPGQLFSSLLCAFGPPAARISSTGIEQGTSYHRLLADLADAGRRVLLVLDNVSDGDQVGDLLPRQAVHRVLVTSRDTLTLPGARRMGLEVFRPRDAVWLLRQAVRRDRRADRRVDGDPAAAGQLVQACGRLPLAIGIAAALLVDDPGLTVRGLVADLAEPTRLTVLRHGDLVVANVVETSQRRLRERDPDTARLLDLLASVPGPNISTAAAAALADVPEAVVAARLRTLRQAHLLGRDNGRWGIHDLVRLHVRAAAAQGDEHRAALTRLLEYYLSTATDADRHVRNRRDPSVSTAFTGQADALAWLDLERAVLVAAVALAVDSAHYELAVDLAVVVSDHLLQRFLRQDLVTVAGDADTAATRLDDPQRMIDALYLRGRALGHTGCLDEAMTVLHNCLGLCQDIGDVDRAARTWSNIGWVSDGAGKPDEAIEAYHHAINGYRQAGNRDGETVASTGLGLTLHRQERFVDAISLHHAGVARSRDVGDRDGEGRAWVNLGIALHGLGLQHTDLAASAYEMGLAAYRDTGNEAEMGQTWHLLAMALWAAGRDEDAIDAFHQARNACRRVRDLRQEAHAASTLGDLLLELRRLDEANVAFRHAQALYRDIGDYDAEANCWFQLGVTLAEARRAKLATAAFRRAQTLYRATGNYEEETLCWLGVAAMLDNDNRDVEAQHARDEGEAAFMRGYLERLSTDTL